MRRFPHDKSHLTNGVFALPNDQSPSPVTTRLLPTTPLTRTILMVVESERSVAEMLRVKNRRPAGVQIRTKFARQA